MAAQALIQLHSVDRVFGAGESATRVLRGVDLAIHAGEYVAIMGPSGSGKSTLMNILGCLDRPSSGEYLFAGRNVAECDPDELARLRREHFGFIFQRYHLLPELSAQGNVEVPAVYSGSSPAARGSRARSLLTRLGLSDRLTFRPSELSGGQQQRVSIARALMNDGDVIFADEPTGALDSRTGAEVLEILEQLNRDGRTIVVVTHDRSVAARARRVIEISDGAIVADQADAPGSAGSLSEPVGSRPRPRATAWSQFANSAREAFRTALLAIGAHRLRAFLTMLGIIIGIASVVGTVAVGEGARRRVISNIAGLGTNTLEIFPGKAFGDIRASKIRTLSLSDARVLAKQNYVAGVTPTASTSVTLRRGAGAASALLTGAGPDYFSVKAVKLREGRFYDENAEQAISQEIVIDENTRDALFPGEAESPIGKTILVGPAPCVIIGVTQKQQGIGASGNLTVYVPFATAQARFTGDAALRSILLRVAESVDNALAEDAVTTLLTRRHNAKDFFIFNTDDIRRTIDSTMLTLTALVAAIAVISLIVGGIGVMNIMLVSVSERVREIGVRMAVGARRADIMRQFLIEAVVVCLLGGSLGIAAAFMIGWAISQFMQNLQLVYSPISIAAAFVSSTLVGVVFGWLPARAAARLDPVAALSRE